MNFNLMRGFFIVSFFWCSLIYSQTEIIHADEVNDSIKQNIPFAVIDEVPIYEGCEDLLTNREKKKCMEEKISRHVLMKFNIGILKAKCIEYKQKRKKKICIKSEYWPGFSSGIARIFVQFKISKQGDIVDIKARAPHEDLRNEAIRVIESIPRLKPGVQKGNKVGVLYSLPITFRID